MKHIRIHMYRTIFRIPTAIDILHIISFIYSVYQDDTEKAFKHNGHFLTVI